MGDRQADGLRAEIIDLRASRRRLVLAADAERRGVERRLHDGVQQQLVGLAANLELAARSIDADPAATKELLAEMAEVTGRALEETRMLAQMIYPPLLEAGGLVAALRSAAAVADVSARIDVPRDRSYPPEIAGTVYFCCLDVLRNLSAGGSVAVTVRNDDEVISFEVVADGVVDADATLRDRVEALGGRCTIDSGSGHRTRVTGSFPFQG